VTYKEIQLPLYSDLSKKQQEIKGLMEERTSIDSKKISKSN